MNEAESAFQFVDALCKRVTWSDVQARWPEAIGAWDHAQLDLHRDDERVQMFDNLVGSVTIVWFEGGNVRGAWWDPMVGRWDSVSRQQ